MFDDPSRPAQARLDSRLVVIQQPIVPVPDCPIDSFDSEPPDLVCRNCTIRRACSSWNIREPRELGDAEISPDFSCFFLVRSPLNVDNKYLIPNKKRKDRRVLFVMQVCQR